MAFIQKEKCNVCGEIRDIHLNNGNTCEECRDKIRRQRKLEWMNERQSKPIEDRLKMIECFIYDHFIDLNKDFPKRF